MPSGVCNLFGVLVSLCVFESLDVLLPKVVRCAIWLGPARSQHLAR